MLVSGQENVDLGRWTTGAEDFSFFNEKAPSFFFNLGGQYNNYYNPWVKTVYYITTATATSAVVTTCIPATQFLAVSLNVCARKRDNARHLASEGLDQQGMIAPSAMNE